MFTFKVYALDSPITTFT